jgi:hypothetical protein
MTHTSAGDLPVWYLVCLMTGSTAVVSCTDLPWLIKDGRVFSAIRVSDVLGREFEEGRARAVDMSANRRIKTGESGGVG